VKTRECLLVAGVGIKAIFGSQPLKVNFPRCYEVGRF